MPHIIAPSPDSTRMRAAVERENDDAFDVAWSRARHGRSVSEASEGDGRRGTAARRASTLLTVNSDDDDEGGRGGSKGGGRGGSKGGGSKEGGGVP